ncbi:hypothetical protein H8356DRAFT_1049422 [Neocallimastix lanati (nom. inval.)]|nr:hypothetical protein H8356DRAFT_1049422 [Neocallimastix sp. JGI-2020a]
MSKNNINPKKNPLSININEGGKELENFKSSSSANSERLTQFPSMNEGVLNNGMTSDINKNENIFRARDNSVMTTKSDTGNYIKTRERGNSNRSDRINGYSSPRTKDVLLSSRSDGMSSVNRSRNNSSPSNYNTSSINKQRIRSNSSNDDFQGTIEAGFGSGSGIGVGISAGPRTRRNNSESDTMFKRKKEIYNETRIGRNNSSKSEIAYIYKYDGKNSSNKNDNNNNSISKGLARNEIIAMDISGGRNMNDSLRKRSDSNNENMNERGRMNVKTTRIRRSKSNINMEVSSPINIKKHRSRSQSSNYKDHTSSGNYKMSEEEIKQFINLKNNFNVNSENKRSNPSSPRIGKDGNSNSDDIKKNSNTLNSESHGKPYIDISTMKTPILESKRDSMIDDDPSDSSLEESPKNIINVASNDQFININHSHNHNHSSPLMKKNDILFPLPPQFGMNSSPTSQYMNIRKGASDSIQVKSSSYNSEDLLPPQNLNPNASKSSSMDSSQTENNWNNNNWSNNDSNNTSNNNNNNNNNNNTSNNNNKMNNYSKMESESSSSNKNYGDLEFNKYNLNYTKDQYKGLNKTSALSNNLMDIKKKKLLNRNTIISTGEYMYEGKLSPLNSRFERGSTFMKSESSLTSKGNNNNDLNKAGNSESELAKSKVVNPNIKKSIPDNLNKTLLSKIMNGTGSMDDISNGGSGGKIFHPVRSHSLHANKLFNGLTLSDTSINGEGGHVVKLSSKKSSASINDISTAASTKNPGSSSLQASESSKNLSRTNLGVEDRMKMYNEPITRSKTIASSAVYNNKNLGIERTPTINSSKIGNNNNSNKSINNNDNINNNLYDIFKTKNMLRPDIGIQKLNAHKNSDLNIFEINEKEVFETIDDSDITLTENPLLSSNPLNAICPSLIDAISTSIPIDAWDFSDDEDEDEPLTPLILDVDENFDPLEGLHTEPRGYVVANLYETEKNYLTDLYTLKNFFKEKLKNIISPVALNSIFEGVDDLLELHKRFYKSLYKVVFNWNKNSLIGKLFIEYRNEWQIYQNFIDNYARSQEAIRREEETNPQFRQFMKDCLASTETNRKSLKEYLMFPVQRTTRYSLIIKDLLKYIDKNHPDYNDLNLALQEMTLLATKVNDVKRREEETTSMFTAFEQTENCPPTIITHKRRLIYQVDVLDVLSKNRRPMHLFLFSDLFMLTKTKNAMTATNIISHPLVRALRSHSKQIYRYVRCIDYRDIVIEEDEQYQQKNIVRLILNFKKERYTTNYYDNKDGSLNETGSDIVPSGTTFLSHGIPDSEYTLYCFQFAQYDAEKQYKKFVLALKTLKEGKTIDWITED